MTDTTKSELLTRFFMFEASEDHRTWRYAGEQLARDRDHAARLFYGDPDDRTIDYCAVSENAWKPKRRTARIVTRAATEDLEMPTKPGPQPVTEPQGGVAATGDSAPQVAPKPVAA